MTETVTTTPDVAGALEVARQLARAGVPVFTARPNPAKPVGFDLPEGWQQTAPDPAAVDAWRPGMALCAVMGRGIDLVDVDPRNGGDLATLEVPGLTHYALAATPSGGLHLFVAPLGERSLDKVAPGIDVKAGAPDGEGRGFAFLAPTVKPSKVTGELAAYRWVEAPDLERLQAAWTRGDDTGAPIAARIRERRTAGVGPRAGGPDWWRNFLLNSEPQSAAAAERAIGAKVADVEGWTGKHPDNFRTVLLRAAMTLGGYVGGGWLAEDDARDRLEAAAAAAWGSADDDDRRWIDQGIADGATRPFYVYTPEDEALYGEAAQLAAGQGEAPPPTADDPAPAVEAPWSVYSAIGTDPFDPAGDSSDQGLAKAVAYRMFPAVRYASDAGTWLLRGREVWEETADDLSDWVVSTLAELMPPGQTPVPKDVGERTEAHWQAVRRRDFTSTAGMGRVARKLKALVRHDHPASVRLAELDSYEEVLWAGGVPWHLRQCGDVPTPAAWIDPNTPHLRTALCAPDPTVPTPRWDAFLAAVLPDPELRAWALRVLSIALTGYPDAALPVLYGRERSGKTSLVEMVVTLLGSYAHAANPKLLNGQDTSHDAMVYDLKGRRLSFIDEGPKRGHDSTERLKQLTGGGSLTASRKYGNPITFATTHTLVMTTNDAPHLTDPALRARIRLIPCDSPEDAVRPARTPLLGRGLRTEAPGILAALMRETAAYLADRDTAGNAAAPVSVRGLAEDMAAEQNPVLEWLQECTVACERDKATKASRLHRAFADWHQAHPLYRRTSVPSPQAFGRTLTDAGVPRDHRRDGWYWQRTVIIGSGGTPSGPVTPASFMAQAPVPATSATPAKPTTSGDSVTALWRIGDASDGGSVTPENGWSSPLSSSSVTDVTDIYKKEEGEEDNKKEGRDREKTAQSGTDTVTVTHGCTIGHLTCENRGCDGLPGGVTGDPCRTEQSATPLSVSGEGSLDAPGIAAAVERLTEREPATDPEVEKKAKANALNREIARLAEETGRTKTELRAEIKAAQKATERHAKITAAAGPTYALPAVVDRNGTVVAIDVETAAQIVRARLADNGGHLTIDVETSGYPVGHQLFELRSVQLGDAMAAVVLHPTTHAATTRALLAEAPVLHAHSATADIVPTAMAGLLEHDEAWSRMWDTVIPAKLADPASTGSDPGLKKLAATVLGTSATAPGADEAREALFKAGGWTKKVEPGTPVEKSGWAQVDTGCETMLRYAASDVLDTDGIRRVLPAPDPRVAERERLAQRMVNRGAHRGVRLDPEQIAALTVRHRAGMDDATMRVRGFGVENPGSDQQVARTAVELGAQLPLTKGGAPSVAKGVLEPLREAEGPLGQFVTAVLDHRHHETALGLFLVPYADLCERGDGRARPTVYTLGTNTGRMSCVRPNLQQLSKKGGIRACITADSGQTIISADFSGVEIRVAAALSQDPTLIRMLAEGRDLHEEIALQVWGSDPEASAKAGRPAPAKAHRYKAKGIVFGRMYGGGLATLSAQVGVTEQVGQQVLDVLDALTPQLKAYSRSVSDAVRAGHTRFPSYSGRTIHLPQDTPHKSLNYVVQGSARELLVDALERWADTPWGGCTLIPVHDELLAFVPEQDGHAATAELQRCMAGELYGIPIVSEADAPSFAWQDST